MPHSGGVTQDGGATAIFLADGGAVPVKSAPDLASSLLEHADYPCFAMDGSMEIVAANSAARSLLGLGGAPLPLAAEIFLGRAAVADIRNFFKTGSDAAHICLSFRAAGKDGFHDVHLRATRLCDRAGKTIGVAAIAGETLYAGSKEKRESCSHRLEVLGLYAAGIVHEFNNLLSVISGRAGLGLMAAGVESKDAAFENVITASRRAEHVTKNLLTYVHRREPDLLLADLRAALVSAVSLLEVELAAAKIVVERDLDELPSVLCDPVQISQVCFNLLRNAKDAMQGGGTINVALRREGRAAVITVADNGPGIAPEMRDRIFEPFASFSGPGPCRRRGTGLGLFVAKEIVLAHKGTILVESEAGKGARFVVKIPLT